MYTYLIPLGLLVLIDRFAGVSAISAGIGAYVRAGLGANTATSTGTITASAPRSASLQLYNITSSNNNLTYSSWLACASSLSSYSAFPSTRMPIIYFASHSYNATINHTYGTGDVYTTSNGIPVAHGNFTPTKVVTTVTRLTSLETISSPNTSDSNHAKVSCSLSPSQCSLLYVSYLASLGLPPNATVPTITPTPTNSPPCPAYYYRPVTGCSTKQTATPTCTIQGQNVQLFYFPPANTTGLYENSSITVIQSIAPGITFTSPSIYLSFDYLTAISILGGEESFCSSCGWGGCVDSIVGGLSEEYSDLSTSQTGYLLTMAPEHVSTLLYGHGTADPASLVQTIARSLEGYSAVLESLQLQNFITRALTLSNLKTPALTDYYLNAGGAAGCNTDFAMPECGTLFEGAYRALLSLPSKVTSLQPAWSVCAPGLYGVYDPPSALEQTTVLTPTALSRSASPTTSPATSTSTPASPSTTQQIPTPTATSDPKQIASQGIPNSGSTADPQESVGGGDPKSTSAVAAPSPAQTAVGPTTDGQNSDIQGDTGQTSALQSNIGQNGGSGQDNDQSSNGQGTTIAGETESTTGPSSVGQQPGSDPSTIEGDPLSVGSDPLANGDPTLADDTDGTKSDAAPATTNVNGGGNPASRVQQDPTTPITTSPDALSVLESALSTATGAGETLAQDSALSVAQGLASSVAIVTVPGVDGPITATIIPDGAVVGSQTLIASSQVNSAALSELVVGTSTIHYQASATADTLGATGPDLEATNVADGDPSAKSSGAGPSTITIGGQAFTISSISSGGAVVNGVTLAPGSAMTVDGQVVSAAPSKGSVPSTITVGGQAFTISSISSGGAVINGVTLSPGSAATVDGQVVSAAPIGGSVPSTITVDGQAFTVSSIDGGKDVINSVTLSHGSATVINGQVVSAGPSGLLIGTRLVSYPAAVTASASGFGSSGSGLFAVTIDGQVYTASSASASAGGGMRGAVVNDVAISGSSTDTGGGGGSSSSAKSSSTSEPETSAGSQTTSMDSGQQGVKHTGAAKTTTSNGHRLRFAAGNMHSLAGVVVLSMVIAFT